KIKENITIPLVADIHFDHKLALRAIAAGADKIRINPGNIGNKEHIKAIADACNQKNIPIRIGVNSGSLEKKILEKYGGVTPEAMVESTMNHIALLNKFDFDNIWLSAKSSSVPLTVKTYRLLHEQTKYPLHLGVTEAGTEFSGIIKSSIGIGALLLDGIGDTIRVSLTAPPEKEIEAAKSLLKALGLRPGIDIISCPTCGRCNIDVLGIASEVGKRLGKNNEHNLTIAVMGCAVNGPGEAKQADYGIAGVGAGKTDADKGVIFAKGKIIKKTPMDKLVDELFNVMATQGDGTQGDGSLVF
ncbi:MAG: flavodoxin-dependent (E)-4-hydroxy-3-methylbut-2-enyl-diphosphate synthase, partial [Oscillospiraceae bacterium]|nr:flavodoxin-dependent (E)-4-hydroxy-3-methylbut-2-enyl-diphosphate synthase [Oscillospiraceae bacterium]